MLVYVLAVLMFGFTSALAQAAPRDVPPPAQSGRVRSDGTVVCRTLAMVAFATQQLRQGPVLPDFKAMRCNLLLEGTIVTIERGDRGPIVAAERVFGPTIRGVADLTTIDIAPLSPEGRPGGSETKK